MHPLVLAAMTGAPNLEVVTLSGEPIIFDADSDPVGPWESISGIRVNTDGTIDKYRLNTGGYSQIDASTDWIIPNGAASSLYEFRLDVTSNAPNYISDSTGTWLAISSARTWLFRNVNSAESSISWNWTLRVRYNGGAEIDSAVYSGSCTNTTL